jgi:SnoaL-like domain
MSDVQTLIDQAAIRDIHLRYCRGVDRMDWALVRSCYHDDATDDHGGYSGGIDGYMVWVVAALARYESTQHFTGNQLVEVDGDTAWAEHYAIVTHRRAATDTKPAADLVVNVRYVDRMERREGKWGIARRVVIADSDRLDVVERTWLSGNTAPAKRDRTDPSYDC